MSKVVHQPIGYNAQRYAVSRFFVSAHQAVNSIVKGRVAPNNNNGLITILDKHGYQSLNAIGVFALHIVKVDAVVHKASFHPTPTHSPAVHPFFGAVQYSPFLVSCHAFILSSLNCFVFLFHPPLNLRQLVGHRPVGV